MADVNARGRFVWHDLMTNDEKAAQSFYPKVVGWGTQEWPGPKPYTMWTAGKTPIGGMMTLPPGAPVPHWLAYISVPDVDASVKQAESLGGKTVHQPTDIPTVGRFAVLGDPQGAYFAVFTSNNPNPEKDGPAAPGEFSWHELLTTDYAAAFRFYEALFGWQKMEEHDMGPMGIYLIFGRNGQQMGGMFNKPKEMQAPPNWMNYVSVPNADKAAELVTANGGTVMNGPMDVPGGDRIAQCMDPQGAAFSVHSRKA